ncbi:MAG: NUDIX hydrolase [Bdellovibrionaceae bacterium]|jgi:ADP-ribose pyrophosphatase|nr:NUDIX hydrolase [Pseudobdellovibrionaceae bacterium]
MKIKWKTLSSEYLFQSRTFKMRVDKCELPDGRVMPKYYVMEFTDWVHVVALTQNMELVLVDQYRHAKQERYLELPGGNLEPNESLVDSAKRELLEETGYSAGNIKEVGEHYPNPALQSNAVRVFLATDCKKVAEQDLDPFEDLTVTLMPYGEALKKLDKGGFKHSLMNSSLLIAKQFVSYEKEA